MSRSPSIPPIRPTPPKLGKPGKPVKPKPGPKSVKTGPKKGPGKPVAKKKVGLATSTGIVEVPLDLQTAKTLLTALALALSGQANKKKGGKK